MKVAPSASAQRMLSRVGCYLHHHFHSFFAAGLNQHLHVVRNSAQRGSELNLIGQTAHQAAIADGAYWPFNTDTSGRAFRNVHDSFWFFHWHRGHLLSLEQYARSEDHAHATWGVPFWNITAHDAAEVAQRVVASYAPERALTTNWTYQGPDESTLLAGNLSELVGALSLRALHSRPHEWFRTSGAQACLHAIAYACRTARHVITSGTVTSLGSSLAD